MEFSCPHCDQIVPHRIEKYCPQCEQTLPHTLFNKNRSRRDNLTASCKACESAKRTTPEARKRQATRMGNWRDRNRSKVRAIGRASYHRKQAKRLTDPELDAKLRAQSAEISKRWNERHPEQRKAISQRNQERTGEQRRIRALASYYTKKAQRATDPVLEAHFRTLKRASNARARTKHPESQLAASARYRAKKKNAPINNLTAEDWEAIKAHYGFRCVYCPDTCKACRKGTHKLTKDHITPLINGGPHTLSNIVPACRSCNGKKWKGPVLRPVQPMLL